MTDKELKKMSMLWSKGYLMKQIASEMGYSKSYISDIVRGHRDLFPYRQCRMDDKHRRKWAENVVEKKVSAKRAAYDAGVHINTMLRWVRWYKEGRL